MSTTESAASVAALLRQGMEHHEAGRPNAAAQSYRQALMIDPSHSEALTLMGILLGQAGKLAEAAELLSRALKRDPRNAQIHYNLAETWRNLDDTAKAEAAFLRTLTLNPDFYDAYQGLADTLLAEAERQQQTGHPLRAIDLRRYAAGTLMKAGHRMLTKGLRRGAAEKFRAAAALTPEDPMAWRGLGNALTLMPSESEPVLRRAMALDATNIWTYNQLGNALMDLMRPDEAEAIYRQGLALAAGDRLCTQGLIWVTLISQLYSPAANAAQIYETHRARGVEVVARVGKSAPFANARDPEKRLKVGYVSPDLKRHSVAYFFEPLLAAHDQTGFETFCYAEVGPNDEDEFTARLKSLAGHWRVTAEQSDEEVCRQIRRDGIDILIDLCGMFSQNRLSVFAMKPAPVTATWLGYPATTGLPNMDWRITDAIVDPPGAEKFHTEKLMRLPGGFLCYRPADDAPDVAPLPAQANGFVTFGSFNNYRKLNESVAILWARVLKAVPGSHLRLKSIYSGDAQIQETMMRFFTAQGVDPARIEVEPWRGASFAEHFAVYHGVDIALDPFPYNGTTTTCEALWLGAPVVTLIGDRHSGRVGLDLLSRIGLAHLAAEDADEYVRKAADLAKDLPALAALRREMRERMRTSPLCDAPRFAREFEAALRGMWRQWCESAVSDKNAP
jgi:predicted O-linked N-acetylglucosamine transferase (SPINDLY family)